MSTAKRYLVLQIQLFRLLQEAVLKKDIQPYSTWESAKPDFLAIMIGKTVYLFLAVLSMLSSTGLLRNLAITGVIWTGADLVFTVWRFLESARRFSTNPVKLLFHMWLVELLGDYARVLCLISANLNGPTWDMLNSSYYELFRWLFELTSYSDAFSGRPQRLDHFNKETPELSTSIIIDENPAQGCLKELKPLRMRVQSCIIILDEESPGRCFIIKSTNVSKKWRFDRSTAEVLYQVFRMMDDVTFIIEGDPTGTVVQCIELNKFINRTILETRSGLIAHRRVVYNDDTKAFV